MFNREKILKEGKHFLITLVYSAAPGLFGKALQHRMTDSGWKGPQEVSGPTSCSKQG